jgi:hypothetical protein
MASSIGDTWAPDSPTAQNTFVWTSLCNNYRVALNDNRTPSISTFALQTSTGELAINALSLVMSVPTCLNSDTRIAGSCTSFRLKNRNILPALCLTDTGKLAVSQTDLDAHLGNHHGKSEAGGINFSHSAKQIRLDVLTLPASLQKGENHGVEASNENVSGLHSRSTNTPSTKPATNTPEPVILIPAPTSVY